MTAHAHTQTRHFTVDALKGFAISCVVMGHVLLRNVAIPNQDSLYLLLSAFEMPLFMFLSGYVLPGKVRGSRIKWVWQRAVRLMVPFFAWHAIFFATRLPGNGRGWSLADVAATLKGGALYLAHTIAAPTAGLWYLPALVLCSAALALYWPLAERPLLLLAAGWVTLAALGWARTAAGFGPDFGLLKTITYWPFFAAGFAWGQLKLPLSPKWPMWKWLPVAAYPFVAIAVQLIMPTMPPWAQMASKIALGLAGVGASALLLEAAEGLGRLMRLDVLGRLTLGVYCSQWLFLRWELGNAPLEIAAGFLFVLTASIVTTLLIGKVPVLRGMLLGEWPKKSVPARVPTPAA